MIISYLGNSCFRLKGKDTTVVVSPFNKTAGLLMIKTPADIVAFSGLFDKSSLERIIGEPFIISGPGEYEIGGVSVFGLKKISIDSVSKQENINTAYVINIDGFRICYLGEIKEILDDKAIDEIDGVDVLIIPVGGVNTIGPKRAITLIEKIEPKVTIPVNYENTEFMKLWGREGLAIDKLNLKTYTAQEESQLVKLDICQS